MHAKHMDKINLPSLTWKEDDIYVSQCLEVDISSSGDTKENALAALQEALELYYEDTPLPKKSKIKNPTLASITLKHAQTH